MKGLILTAGKGTRLRPLSYTKPKPLLPVANKAVISYGIDRLYSLGIRDIGLVIQQDQKELVEKYIQLEARRDIRFHYIYQHEQKGIAHAVKQAEDFIDNNSFVLLLGDNLIEDPLNSLMDHFNKKDIHGTVMVNEVSRPEDYGIAEIKNNKIINIEEKPVNPKSNLAVIGAYIFKPTIFRAIHAISPSARGEYEITDAIQWMIDHGYTINYVKANKPTFDVGTMERWLEANQWMLKQNSDQWDDEFNNGNVQDSVIIPPVKIGDNCKIKDSVIGPYVSIESDTTVQKCIIKNSIVLKGSCLTNIPYVITDSVFGEKTKLIGKDQKDDTIHGIFGDESSITFSKSATNKKGKQE
ncbi:glucose-1-phosphate thymidylyltransferase [Virgibacillus necropolis]|uniref:glucose-1-phosphate thymidylyltransferase n=1 Tax=Virgibacillus necropolis TaxID=163877 RepID=UPI00384CC543